PRRDLCPARAWRRSSRRRGSRDGSCVLPRWPAGGIERGDGNRFQSMGHHPSTTGSFANMLQSHHGKPNAPTPFDQALDAVEGLPEDAQIELLDVVRRRLAERGRRRVIKEVTEAEAE